MKSIWTRCESARAAFVASLVKYKDRQPPPITLSMIAMELENDLMQLRSRFVRVITKVYGTVVNWLYINRR